jgi:hypothetical protein
MQWGICYYIWIKGSQNYAIIRDYFRSVLKGRYIVLPPMEINTDTKGAKKKVLYLFDKRIYWLASNIAKLEKQINGNNNPKRRLSPRPR